MKNVLIVSLALLAAAFVIPLLALGQAPLAEFYTPAPEQSPPATVPPSPPEPSGSPAPQTEPSPAPSVAIGVTDAETTLRVQTADGVEIITMREFLYGVVAAEMPALYRLEALKAQAVAARTFALGKHMHAEADICGDPAHCLAYRPLAVTAAEWGGDGGELSDKIRAAVDQTDGQVLTYEGRLIDALFFAVSSGSTENAADVWGTDLPYLRGVDSPWDMESPGYESSVTVSVDEARRVLGASRPGADLSGDPGSWFGTARRSAAGGVISISAGGAEFTGAEVRTLFGLRSHNFNVTAGSDGIVFTVYGYGHGVGMSQFGARQMALLSDSDYAEILMWYYRGVGLSKISREESPKE